MKARVKLDVDPTQVVEELVERVEHRVVQRRVVGVQVDPSETRGFKGMYFQQVETERFQPRVNLMSTCTALPRLAAISTMAGSSP